MKNTDFTAFLYFLAASVRQLNLLSRQQNLSHISLRKQIMNLIRRIHNRTNRCRMIHRINDQCKELLISASMKYGLS